LSVLLRRQKFEQSERELKFGNLKSKEKEQHG